MKDLNKNAGFSNFKGLLSWSDFLNSFMTESVSYKNQSIDLLFKSMDWFLYDRDLRHERVNWRVINDITVK